MVSSGAYGGAPSDAPERNGGIERSPRTNVLLSATLESGTLKVPVRIRNLSESGALLEGTVLPRIGERLKLTRLELDMTATVSWHANGRCGVRFDAKIFVPDWVAGKWSGTAPQTQSDVDAVQASIRSGTVMPVTTQPPAAEPSDIDLHLDARLAEEMDHIARLLGNASGELADNPLITQRHGHALQSLDLASQIVLQLARIMASNDRAGAVNALKMEDLRSRLLRKSMRPL